MRALHRARGETEHPAEEQWDRVLSVKTEQMMLKLPSQACKTIPRDSVTSRFSETGPRSAGARDRCEGGRATNKTAALSGSPASGIPPGAHGHPPRRWRGCQGVQAPYNSCTWGIARAWD